MRLSNTSLSIDIPDEDWRAALSSARRGKDEPDLATAARGHLLGKAMQILRLRRQMQAVAAETSTPSPDQVRRLVDLMMQYDAYGHDDQAAERLRLGKSIPHGTRTMPLKSRDQYESDAQQRIIDAHASASAALCRDSALPKGWTITVIGPLPDGHESRDTHISDEAW
ncbi:hypothetical protein [Methylobrevis pamukkalensis]|uniref:Uncharacterized protein n=1 Tax=Methylobrevis pamukkalensis TaxID=1439726 RepID=A0A1E3GZS6_9HYPH|nr:hypothetical protein [Methylobrevis pamukkalensis]ODN69578.1 hypothetical protein A6302_03124 [Methylobrevis pamukkalensis]